MAYGFKTIEKKYGVIVEAEEWWHPLKRRFVTTYNIYTADGCSWEKGLSRAGVKKEVEEWSESLLKIKHGVENKKKEV